MGCGGTRVIQNENQQIPNKDNFITEIKKKFAIVLKSNSFYQITIDKFKQIITNCTYSYDAHTFEYINNLDIDDLTKKMFVDIFTIAKSRLEICVSKDKLNSFLFSTIILFLSKPIRVDIKEEKKKILSLIIKETKLKSEYNSGKLSFLILNLIYFFLNIFLYFLMTILILQYFENLNKSEFNKLFLNKETVGNISYDTVQEYIHKKLKEINPKLSNANSVIDVCLPYILDPIKQSKN